MKDIVRILQDIALDKGITYHYGKKAALNLLDGSLDADKIFLLHEFTNRKSEYSDLDQQYFAEAGTPETSKYTVNIEPLLQVFQSIGNSIACLGLEVTQWDNIDVTDALDANMDGLLCSYKLRIPINHE